MTPETLLTIAVLGAGPLLALVLSLVWRPRRRPTTPDERIQASADRLEVEQVAGIEDEHADDQRAVLHAVGTDDRRARLERIAALDER